MSALFYDIPLEEEYDHEPEPYRSRTMSDDHFQKIAKWLPKEFDKCEVHKAFDGILKNKVTSCKMSCIRIKRNGRSERPDVPTARIKINFIPGFRLSEKRRQACFEQMHDQMVDEFGEIYDHAEIPDGDGWQLKF